MWRESSHRILSTGAAHIFGRAVVQNPCAITAKQGYPIRRRGSLPESGTLGLQSIPDKMARPSAPPSAPTTAADHRKPRRHNNGAFAGLRSAEIERLDWKNVNFECGFIEVRAETCKTRARRLVPICENLRA